MNNRARILLSLGLLLLASGAARAQQAPSDDIVVDAAVRRALIDSVFSHLRGEYVFPEVAVQTERAVRARQARGDYDTIASGRAFAARLTADLRAVAHDKHLGVDFSPEVITAVGASRQGSPEARDEFRRYVARRNGGFRRVEVLPGNVGYISMLNFFPPEWAGETLAAAMRFVAGTDALILDLRGNWGGNPDMVALLLSHFVPAGTHLNDFYNRVDGTTRQVWSQAYAPGGRYAGDVYVLTDSVTISAAEEAAYDLQALRRGTVVGAVSAGGANPGGAVRIADHFSVFVPIGRAINPITHTNWEGTGVTPDVPARGEDALATAHLLALRNQLSRTTDADEQARLRAAAAERERELAAAGGS